MNILHKWCQDNNLDGKTIIGITKINYANNDTTLYWLQHFIDYISKKRWGAWLHFIIDGYGSHITIPFHNLATTNKVALFWLLSYSTYLTQPLDVEIIQSFKYYHTNTIDKVVQLGNERFGKLKFLTAFQSFCNQTFKFSIIQHAFKSTSLVPFNPDVVLHKIREKQA